jgi:hypothetical protein
MQVRRFFPCPSCALRVSMEGSWRLDDSSSGERELNLPRGLEPAGGLRRTAGASLQFLFLIVSLFLKPRGPWFGDWPGPALHHDGR